MGALLATPLKDASLVGRKPRLWRDGSGWRGYRWFMVVGTQDETEATFAPGIPTVGSPWGSPLLQLRVYGYEPDWPGGNVVYVRVDYDTGQSGGYGPPPPTEYNTSRTVIQNASSTIPVRFDIAGNQIAEEPEQVLVSTVAVEVLAYVDENQFTARFQQFLGAAGKLNTNPLTLPSIYGGPVSPITVLPGYALLESYNIGRYLPERIVESVVRMQIRPPAAWRAYRTYPVQDGLYVSSQYDVYETTAFPQLW